MYVCSTWAHLVQGNWILMSSSAACDLSFSASLHLSCSIFTHVLLLKSILTSAKCSPGNGKSQFSWENLQGNQWKSAISIVEYLFSPLLRRVVSKPPLTSNRALMLEISIDGLAGWTADRKWRLKHRLMAIVVPNHPS